MNTTQIDGPITLLKKGWALFISHSKVLIPIILLPFIISAIGSILSATHQPITIVIGVLIAIAGAIMSIAMGPALVNAVHRLTTEPGVVITLKEQYRFGFKLFWSVVLVAIIVGFVSLGSYMLLVIPGIVVSMYILLYLYTFTIDGKRGFSALTESYSLIRGRWWSVFWRALVIAVAMAICWGILSAIIFSIAKGAGMSMVEVTATGRSVATVGARVVAAILNLIGGSVLVPVSIGAMYSLYLSLKVTRQAEVPTNVFKNWLIAFICIGILAPIIAMLVGGAFLIRNFRKYMSNVQQVPYTYVRTTTESPQASTTPVAQ